MQSIIINIIFLFSLLLIKFVHEKLVSKSFFLDVYEWHKYLMYWIPSILFFLNLLLGIFINYIYFLYTLLYAFIFLGSITIVFFAEKKEERKYSKVRKKAFKCLSTFLNKNLISNKNVKIYIVRKAGFKAKQTLIIKTSFPISNKSKGDITLCLNRELNSAYIIKFE